MDGRRTGALSVLIVEDDAPTRMLLVRVIRETGQLVRGVADAQAALTAMEEEEASIVLSDIRLPGEMDGTRLCAALREAHPDVEIILVTAFASIDTAVEGMKLGACDYLLKPFENLDLVRRSIAQAAERFQRRLAERDDIRRLRAAGETLGALLHRLPVAIVLVDSQRRIAAQNRAATEILRSTPELRVSPDGSLACNRAADDRLLRAAISTCCAEPSASAVAVTVVREGSSAPLRLLIAPVAADGDPGRRSAAIVIAHPDRQATPPDSEILCALYGLTRAESALAARLAAGDSVQEACDRLEICVSTARTHLRRIYAKTGTRRQGDLVGLILSGPGLLAAGVRRSAHRVSTGA